MKTDLITVHGRVLPTPGLQYGPAKVPVVANGLQYEPSKVPVKSERKKFIPPKDGSWNMIGAGFNDGGDLRNWSYLMIFRNSMPTNEREVAEGKIREKVAEFHQYLQVAGITAPMPLEGRSRVITGPDDRTLEDFFRLFDCHVRGLQGKPGFLLIILPARDPALYNRIKQLGDITFGIHTVCVVADKFCKRGVRYYANVALKFNLKLGGVNQLLDNKDNKTKPLGIIDDGKTMVVGLDVTHPSPGSTSNAPSVAGMVASVDKILGQWPAILRIQNSREEMVEELRLMLESRLVLWRDKNRELPQNLLVYRDGVSEGQYATVLDSELPLLREACNNLYPATDSKKGLPRITIIIVGKRHHTRFYPTVVKDADSSSNPRNGTVVDRGITEARNWDFFLQSHTALQGTARPAHYYVVLDEIFTNRKVSPTIHNAAAALEQLTHHMCYLFGRATTAVRVCPPVYYADIVCERARCYLSRLFDDNTPSGTPAQSEVGDGGFPGARGEDVLVHPRLRDTMFYI